MITIPNPETAVGRDALSAVLAGRSTFVSYSVPDQGDRLIVTIERSAGSSLPEPQGVQGGPARKT